MVELLSLGGLSSINDKDNQHQVQITNTLVNQLPSSTVLSSISTNIIWLKALKNITESRGRTVLLECQVKSLYPVSFTWYRYNNPIDRSNFIINDDLFKSSIRLKSLKESQTGFYTCEVSNGLETLTSTGFVRLKASNVDTMDLSDDLLPSIEFQPEIVTNNEGLINKLTCEVYQGNICRSIIGSKNVSLSALDQKEVDKNLFDNIQILSNECRQLLLPMVCFFVYPICDTINQSIRKSVCRKSCYYFENHACMRNFFNQYQHTIPSLRSLYNIPTCDNLPPSSDDISCITIDHYQTAPSYSNDPVSDTNLLSTESFLESFLIIFIIILFICLLILLIYCCYSNKSHRNHVPSCSLKLSSRQNPCHPLNSVHLSTYYSPSSTRQNHHLMKSSSSASTNTSLSNKNHRQALLKTEAIYQQIQLPSISDALREIPFTNIRFLEEIGEGEFGRIFIGELINSETKCIVKTLEKENVKNEYLREVEIFRSIHHVNISCLIGICIPSSNTFSSLIYESLNHGDLHEYLLLQDSTKINLTNFIFISQQIISGMIYLCDRKILHNDLSTKNILMCEHFNIKITNIGRYRRKYCFDYYKIANRLLPVRWMSIEALLSGIYSEMSDVWSFGVLLWEMFSYGIQPYYGHTNPEVIEMIRDRMLLKCPKHCPREIYELMYSCWEEIPDQRPTFIELMQKSKELQEKSITILSTDDELI